MSFFVNASQEQAFRSVMDYFTGRRMKTLASNAPSYIKAEFGWGVSSETSEYARGEVEANIVKRNGGSYVNLSFDFSKEWISIWILIAIFVVIILILYAMLNHHSWLIIAISIRCGCFCSRTH